MGRSEVTATTCRKAPLVIPGRRAYRNGVRERELPPFSKPEPLLTSYKDGGINGDPSGKQQGSLCLDRCCPLGRVL